MRRDLMDILQCPACAGDLALKVMEERKDEIIKGELTCKGCSARFPIEDGIPVLLAPEEK